jgi:hypothetical protein
MRQTLTIAIVGSWLVMLGMLVQRTWVSAPAAPTPVVDADRAGGGADEWMGVYHQSQKIGYTHQHVERDAQGYAFAESSLLRLTVMDSPQTVRTQVRGRAGTDYALRQVEFELSSGAGHLVAQGVIEGETLRLTMRTGEDVSERTIPVHEPLYIASLVRNLLPANGLQPEQRFDLLVFDPTALANGRLSVVVEGKEPVPDGGPGVHGWRVREEFHGLRTTAWLDDAGGVLREEGPMGLTLVRESQDDAMHRGWNADALFDVVARAAVPVARPIVDPRNRRQVRLRLSGIDAARVPSDDQQQWDGSVLTITRPDLGRLQSYRLPYTGNEHAEELRPSALLQSDHPRVRMLARQIVGEHADAAEAARRLNDWVYATLRKVPTMSLPNALQVLDMGEGDCNEHAVLLAALGRAAGLPTRVVAGAVYVDGAFLYHAWCEVWLGRWVSIDPAFGQFPADATHIKFVAGGPEEQIAMVDIIGRLGVEVLADGAPAAS